MDRIHIGQDSRIHRRPSQMETTRAWCGQALERGRLKARQGNVCYSELQNKLYTVMKIKRDALLYMQAVNKTYFKMSLVTAI